MAQNISQMTATGSYSDASTADITAAAAWTSSDSTIVSIGAGTGAVTVEAAGKIWGGIVGITATLSPGTPGTASLIVIPSDSGSIAPRMPLKDYQWQALGLSPWGMVYGLQEPSGSALVSSGSFTRNLTTQIGAGGGLGPQMQSTEPGWTRNCVVMTGSQGMNYSWAGGVTPQMSSSIAFLLYAKIHRQLTPYAAILGSMRSNAGNSITLITDPNGTNTGMAGMDALGQGTKVLTGPHSITHDDRVHPFLLVVNTGSQEILACTDNAINFSASNARLPFSGDGNNKGFGGYIAAGKSTSGSFYYFAVCTGSVAERLSSPVNAADFLERLGWQCQWKTCPTDSGSIKLPFLAHHWAELGLTPWTSTWNLQETLGGNISTTDVWSGTNLHAWRASAANVTHAYRVPEWKRRGLNLAGQTSRRMIVINTIAGAFPLWNQTGSLAMMTYAVFGTQAAGSSRSIMASSPGANRQVMTVAAHSIGLNALPAVYCCGAAITGSQALADGRVHPVLLVYDTAGSRVKLYTDLEKITGSYAAMTQLTSATGVLGMGQPDQPGISLAASGTYVYYTITTGSVAENLSDDGRASKFLKDLGWTVSW